MQGTLFPGLDLPFRKELRSRFPQVNEALLELMALDFAIDELGLYLVTHADDKEVLDLYWKYIALAKEGRARYQEQYGPQYRQCGANAVGDGRPRTQAVVGVTAFLLRAAAVFCRSDSGNRKFRIHHKFVHKNLHTRLRVSKYEVSPHWAAAEQYSCK